MADAPRYLLRPAALADLPGLERLAGASAIGISSLPADREALRERIVRSQRSFADGDEPDAHYLFVLEDRQQAGALVGTGGIAARAGAGDRFYSYRNEFTVHASPALGVRNRIHTLHLCHDLTGATVLTGFHIDPAHEDGPGAQLLSRGRLLFIASFPERFTDRIVSEHPGLADESGACPFWDAVGRRFFHLDYPAAERLASGQGRAFLAELLPQSPIYVPLLDEATQWALGQLHPVAERPFSILLDEGFDADTWLNVFDGGPTMEARLPMLKTARRLRSVGVLPPAPRAARGGHATHLAAGRRLQHWRATLLALDATAPAVALRDDEAALLGLAVGDSLCVAALDGPDGT
ncbi:arginine N-succinyltransferase [Ideonella sp. 4Y16]|uniref:Arginine N-succinyltransferase n=1 Tax=Ideonella alba TaxID=2824118 RepID=A0A940YFZ1_9BURK|nr:arginine N-succinyltransferase [Ideonella alba]MBQ0929279.1 arginine N-succinyltransferase [Ideonella alba]MBQ0945390.1 arginine N-succinyltransferase [Ideonella alba]